MLPVHFFTIVLNGQPFIRYHLDVLRRLPFPWHWHVVEGVADLKHDTAWSIGLGGRVAAACHRDGRSHDGTSEYLDEIQRAYPDRITLYRKPAGVFWDGKREMVNAPLANIQDECLLWQIDADELWTAEQFCAGRQMFLDDPSRTAAYYWCWYFVGDRLVVSTRNCFSQNPNHEWLRTWRYQPGDWWAAHEPPRLVRPVADGEPQDLAALHPFRHAETEARGLVFQHFAYVTLEQLAFKECYYGLKGAVAQWVALQEQKRYPVYLRDYFSWVKDDTQADTVETCGITPLAQRVPGAGWEFAHPDQEHSAAPAAPTDSPRVVIDGVFFQLLQTGIARLWRSLLEEWAATPFGRHVVLLDRGRTAPPVPGIRSRVVPPYDLARSGDDSRMLQRVCDEEAAGLFVSTYYTTPLTTPSAFLAYDMIPEATGFDLTAPQWREKHLAIHHACAFLAISASTAADLARFFPHIPHEAITVAHCGVGRHFFPASAEELARFREKQRIGRPYFLLMGNRGGYKNAAAVFQALAEWPERDRFALVCTGGAPELEPELAELLPGGRVHVLNLEDDGLRAALSGATALVYPSLYEGFGLPVLEALACGCPVVTTAASSLPEVGGDAVLYLREPTPAAIRQALDEVRRPEVRERLIAAGRERARQFTWAKMATTVADALLRAADQPSVSGRHADPLWLALKQMQAQWQRAADVPSPAAVPAPPPVLPFLRVLRGGWRRMKRAFA